MELTSLNQYTFIKNPALIKRLLPAFATGILFPLSFAGFDYWPLCFIAFVPLMLAIRNQSLIDASLLSWFMGFVCVSTGFSWIVGLLKTFSGFNIFICVIFAIIFWIYLAGLFAFCGFLTTKLHQRHWPFGFAFVAALCVAELIYPVLFPWYLGASLHTVPVLMQLADIGGPILISMIIIATNAAIAEILYSSKNKIKPNIVVIIFGFTMLLFSYFYGQWRINEIEDRLAKISPVKIGLVQPNIPLLRKSTPFEENTPIRLTKQLKNKGAELAIWSESASSKSFSVDDEASIEQNLTSQLKIPTIIGLALYKQPAWPNLNGHTKIYNSALMADKSGAITARYDKHFLLMFGEYLPFGEWFPMLYDLSPNTGHMQPGNSIEPFKFQGHSIGVNICYEDIIPGFINNMMHQTQAELLVNMTNDAWFGKSIAPWQHLALAKFRAIEHHKYLARATNTGVSSIIDPTGKTQFTSELFKEQALTGEIKFLTKHTLYYWLGNVPFWILAIVVLIVSFRRKT